MSEGDRAPTPPEVEIQRLRACVAALESEARGLRAMLYSIGDGVISTDATGRVTQVNPVAAALTGWPEADAAGRPLAEVFRIINEDSRAEVESPVARVLREGTVVGLANHTLLLARDGTERPIADSGAPIRDAAGAITGVVLVFRDRTAERAMQQALTASLARHEALLAAVPDIVMEVDVNKVYTWANEPGRRFFGSDVIGREAAHYFEGDQDTYDRVAPIFTGAEHTFYVESWQRRQDGERRLLAWWCRVLKDDAGRVTGALSTARDVTAERAAEGALRASEARFRSVFEHSPLGKSMTEIGGRLRINPAFAALLGYSEAELAAKTWQEITYPDDVKESADIIQALLDGKQTQARWEKRYLHKSGRVIWTDIATAVHRDERGQPLFFITTAADITERKRMEAELRRHRDDLEALVAQRTEQLAESEQRLAQESAAAADIVGEMLRGELSDAEVERQVLNACLDATKSTHGMIGAVNEHGRYDVKAYSSRALSDCAFPEALAWKMSTGMEIRGIWGWPMLHGEALICNDLRSHPDRVGQPHGHLPVESFLGVPVKRDGEVVGMVAVANKAGGYTDADAQTLGRLTDIMVVSRRHRELLTELEQRVRDRTARLEESNRELEAFSYSVSHDLRAPLRAIDGFTGILLREYAPRLDAEGRRLCGVVRDGTRSMARLIDDLLAFSRLGRVDMNLARIDMGSMATALFYEMTTPESRERIDFRVGAVPLAFGDPTLMRQVWQNLIANAVKFSAKRERAVIEVRGEQQEREAIYSVTDNGAGFDMQYAGKLFRVFQRLHGSGEFEGTGVGLALVQRVIRRHGGRVWAEGAIDCGATFHFALPQKGA